MKKYLISIGISTTISALMVGSLFLFANEKFNELSDKLARLASLGASQAISSLTELTSLSQNDVFPITDTANGTTKKVKWGTATSSMKTIFDSVYSPIFSTSAGLFGLVSNETGSGLLMGNDTPSLLTPNITTPTLDVTGTDATGDIYYNGGSGVLTRLGIGAGTSYYLRSSAGGIPEWDNTGLMTNPQVASSTFTATTTFTGNMIGTKIMASSTAGSTITGGTLPQPVSLSTSTNRINPADANDYMFFDNFYGFAVQSGASGASILVQREGVVSGFSGLTVGATYYVQDAVGTIGTSVGTYEMKVGIAVSPTEILIERGTNEYLGSVTATCNTICTATTTFSANMVIVNPLIQYAAGGNPSNTISSQFTFKRLGAKTATAKFAGFSGGAALEDCQISTTWNTTNNVLTSAGSCAGDTLDSNASMTVYMYR